MDVNKVLLDYENESEIPETEDRTSKFRYSVINAAAGFLAKCVQTSVKHKPYVGKQCYMTATLINFYYNSTEFYGVELEQYDGSRIKFNVETLFFIIMNGRFGGSRVPMSPTACLNDGLLDAVIQNGPAGTKEVLKFFKNFLIFKGMFVYQDNYSCFRSKSIRITNQNQEELKTASARDEMSLGMEEAFMLFDQPRARTQLTPFQIDGEALWFKDFVKIEAIQGAVEIIVDYKQMMEQKGIALSSEHRAKL